MMLLKRIIHTRSLLRAMLKAMLVVCPAISLTVLAVEGESAVDQNPPENVTNIETEDVGLGLTITGHQEFPKSLIIIPWNNPGLGELVGKNYESLIEKEENSLDRDEYLRELAYEQVKSSP